MLYVWTREIANTFVLVLIKILDDEESYVWTREIADTCVKYSMSRKAMFGLEIANTCND